MTTKLKVVEDHADVVRGRHRLCRLGDNLL